MIAFDLNAGRRPPAKPDEPPGLCGWLPGPLARLGMVRSTITCTSAEAGPAPARLTAATDRRLVPSTRSAIRENAPSYAMLAVFVVATPLV